MDRKKKLESALSNLFGRTSPKPESDPQFEGIEKSFPIKEPEVKPLPEQLPKTKKSAVNNNDKPVSKAKGTKQSNNIPLVEKREEYPPVKGEDISKQDKISTPPMKEETSKDVVDLPQVVNEDNKSDKILSPEETNKLTIVDDGEEERQYLIFVLNNTIYGVDVSFVQTTIKPQPIYLLPGTVEFIKGLINLRGTVVPVIDLRTRFGLDPIDPGKMTRFIVVEIEDTMASLTVDEVRGVETIKTRLIEKPSSVVMDINTKFLTGIARFNNQLILILDLDQTIIVTENEG